MPVVLSHNETLDLNLAEYAGRITLPELMEVAGYGAKNPHFLKTDTLNIVTEAVDFSGVALSELDALFARYRLLFAPLNFQIYRRSAWLCHSKAAEPYVAYWLGEHDLKEAMSSTVRMFHTLPEAADWLLLGQADLPLIERREGFKELAVIDDARNATRAAAR